MTTVTQLSRRTRVEDCPFCSRHLALTFHHLIPRKLHRRNAFRRRFSREQLGRGIYICRDCHDAIHERYSEIELAKRFYSPQALSDDPGLTRHFCWLGRQRRAR